MACSLASDAQCAMLGRVEPRTEVSGTVNERVDFDCVYESMVQYVWGVVCRMGVPRSDAEDVVQEVFVTVYRRLGDFERRAQLKTWVFSIAVHFAQHYFRTHARKPGNRATEKDIHDALEWSKDQALTESRESGPASQLERMEGLDALDRVLAQLNERQRVVFVLAELEQMTLTEIAEVVGSNANTVATRLRAARKAFEKALARFQSQGLERKL
ncbi:MAG TPA: sigma-70 family RNA polymerase sigma factor [Polyangiaceae bacterium]